MRLSAWKGWFRRRVVPAGWTLWYRLRVFVRSAWHRRTSVDPVTIHHSIDSLGEQAFLTTDLVPVDGWACSEAGVAAVELYLNGVFHDRFALGQDRPDVAAAFPEVSGAGKSGFSGTISLLGRAAGSYVLTVTFRDHLGRSVAVDREISLVEDDMLYHRYFLGSIPSEEEEAATIASWTGDASTLSFDLWLEVDGSPETALSDSIRSVLEQSNPHWRLHLLRRGDSPAHMKLDDPRIALALPDDMARITAEGGPVLMAFMRAGEVLAPGALTRMARFCRARPDTALFYSDHDHIRQGGLHCAPSFKPGWSPDHLLSRNYIGGVFFLRASPESVALCSETLEKGGEAWRYHLLLRACEQLPTVGHVPEVLWSRPLADDALSGGEDEAVCAALQRRGWSARVESTDTGGVRRLRWPVAQQPRVTIIVPTTGKPSLVRACVQSLLQTTAYPNYELVFVDNGRGRFPEGIAFLEARGLRVIERDEPFNWAKLNNDGVLETTGELLLFLNDDVEIVDPTWLDELVAQSCREDVGCVGAMLVYPDDRIQHAGVFLVDHGGGARHFLHGAPRTATAYQHLNRVVREVSANTGACLMIRRELFERVGGFDEALAVAGNDVDLCLRVGQAGYRNIWTPHCRVVHHESVSRMDINIRDDEGRMWQRWERVFMSGDPFYNANLTQRSSDCSLNLEVLAQRERSNRAPRRESAGCPGVNLIGYIKAEMGIGEAMRGLASACDAAGVSFDIYNHEQGNPSRMGDLRWSHKITDEPGQSVNLLHVNADLTARTWKALPRSLRKRSYTIGYWAWELPEFPDEWVGAFDVVDEVWVPSEFVRRAVAAKASVPVVCVPHVVERARLPRLGRAYFGLPEDAFLWLMMYDVHSVAERKNPKGAIDAFKRAFAKDDAAVGLVVKVNNGDDAEKGRLTDMIGEHANIRLVTHGLGRYEVDSLINSCDAFLSLHRSEGFGLALAEAMALGKPAVATGWSGNTDFMNDGNSACVEYQLVTLAQDHGPYKAGQVWAEPDLDDAVRWMRRIRSDGDLRADMGARARRDVADLLSARRIGALIADRLRCIEGV